MANMDRLLSLFYLFLEMKSKDFKKTGAGGLHAKLTTYFSNADIQEEKR